MKRSSSILWIGSLLAMLLVGCQGDQAEEPAAIAPTAPPGFTVVEAGEEGNFPTATPQEAAPSNPQGPPQGGPPPEGAPVQENNTADQAVEPATSGACTADLFLDVQPDPSNNDLPDPVLNVSCFESTLSIQANQIPTHPVVVRGQNTITAQDNPFAMTLAPAINAEPTPLNLGDLFGITTGGVTFDPLAAEFYNDDFTSGWNYNALSIQLGLDQSNGHVQPTGEYHYHSLPNLFIDQVNTGGDIVHIGFAADGFPIYVANNTSLATSSYQVRSGTRPDGPGGAFDGTYVEDYEYVVGSGTLDQCNGLDGPTAEFPDGIYHYFITEEFPHVPRCYRGTPDDSFLGPQSLGTGPAGAPPNGGQGGPGQGGPPNGGPGGPPPSGPPPGGG